MAKSNPDGYTLLLTSPGPVAINPSLMPNLPYNPRTDLAPVSLVGIGPNVLAVPAASPEARGKGVLVVMNDEINCARDVNKSNTYRVETFRSGELGFLGYVDPDKVSFYRAPTKRHTADSEFEIAGIETFPQVEIVYSYVQPDVTLTRTSDPGEIKRIFSEY